MKPQDLHPASQGVRERRHEEDLRGAGEQEPSGGTMGVDFLFEGGEQGWDPLHLVEGCPLREPGDKTCRIGSSSSPGDIIVKADIFMPPGTADPAGKRGLAALARPVNEHRGRISQRFRQGDFGGNGDKAVPFASSNCKLTDASN